ncbi:MAG: SBBP repeat-containing protein [Candidatus Hodarchaeota archaeon]
MQRKNSSKWLGGKTGIIRGAMIITVLFTLINPPLFSNFPPEWKKLSKRTSNLFSTRGLLQEDAEYPKFITWCPQELSQTFGAGIAINGNYICTVGDLVTYNGNEDIFLVRWDREGSLLWYETWGGPDIEATSSGVTVDDTGNIYTTGAYYKNDTEYGCVLVKWDRDGNQLWNRTWKAGTEIHQRGKSVIAGNDGSIYTVGFIYSEEFLLDLQLIRWDQTGEQLWNRTWRESGNERGTGVAIDSNNNIYTTGHTNSFGTGDPDHLIVKWNQAGEQLWNRTWDSTAEGLTTINDDFVEGIAVDNKDNVYIAGYYGEYGNNFVLVKWDTAGNRIWHRTRAHGASQAVVTIGSQNNNIYTIEGGEIYSKFPKALPMDFIKIMKWNTEGQLLETQASGYQGQGKAIEVSDDGKIYCTGLAGVWPNHTSFLLIFSANNFLSIQPTYTSGLQVSLIILTLILAVNFKKRRKKQKEERKSG